MALREWAIGAGAHRREPPFLVSVAVGALLAGCSSDAPSGPDPAATASLDVRFALSGEAEAAVGAPGVDAAFQNGDAVGLRIARQGAPVLDTTMSISPAPSDAEVDLELELREESETVTLTADLLGGEYRLFEAVRDVELVADEATEVLVTFEPVMTGIEPASSLAAGQEFTCAVGAEGLLYCWGRADLRRDEEDPEFLTEPRLMAYWPRFEQVTAGDYHGCALTSTETVHCWGSNRLGQLGDGTVVDRDEPAPVSGGTAFTAVDAGGIHTCAVSSGGEAYCWGGTAVPAEDFGGGMGYDLPDQCPSEDSYLSDRCSRIPRPVNGGHAFSHLSAGVMFTCGVSEGSGYCWGSDIQSQLGLGPDSIRGHRDPQPMGFEGGFQWVAAGSAFACGADETGGAHCWGNLHMGETPQWDFGQLGNGDFEGAAAPVPVQGEHTFHSLAASSINSIYAGFSCGITVDDEAWCWGLNDRGQLGGAGGEDCLREGASVDCRSTPGAVTGGVAFRELSLGLNHTCGVSTEGAVYCWGGNDLGQLGDGTTHDRMAPERVTVSGSASALR